jgi:hypothetical protein
MATYAQTPGLLNIKGVVGAHFSCQLTFGTSLVGYTFDSAIVLQEYPVKREQAITVTVDNAAQGIITLSLTQNQTTSVGVIAKKKWYLNWTISGIKQTILAGTFELSDIPLGQNIVTSTGVTINTQDVDVILSAFSNAALDGKQPLDADLTAIAGLTPNNDDFLQRKSGAWTNRSIAQVSQDLGIGNKLDSTLVSAFGLTLIDDADAPAARSTLALGTISTQNANNVAITGGTISGISDISLADGGTNNSLTPVLGGVVYSTASQLAISGAGASGQYLRSNGAAVPSWETPSSIATGAFINNDTFTNSEYYPVFAYQSNGTPSSLYGSSSKLKYNPSNGYLYSDGIFSGAATFTTPLGLSSGGTNSSITPASGGVIYSTSNALAVSSAGTSGQFLRSNGTDAPTWETPSATAGNATIFNDNTTNREYFPVFAYQSAGVATTLYGSSTKLKFNPSNGYFTTDGGFFADSGNLEFRDGGVGWAGQTIFGAETQEIYDSFGTDVASWGSGNGMYITGTASKDLPLRLMDTTAGNLSTGAYIIVRPHSTDTLNGARLTSAYAEAKTFTPQGSALSATNRATIILLPGRYNLGTTRLNLDTDFVDIIGLTDTPEQVVITSSVILSDSGTIYQTANDVKIKGVTIDRTGNPAGSGAGRTAAYFPFPRATAITTWSGNGTTMTIAANGHGLQTGDSVRISGSGNSSVDGAFTVTRIDDNSFSYPSTVNDAGSIGTATERFNLTYIENCVFSGTSGSGMRTAIEYSGTYRKCIGGDSSFAGVSGGVGTSTTIASGLFEDCTSGSFSFGGSGTASGTFTRCTSNGTASFGRTSSGTFTDCVGGDLSFGGQPAGAATGVFLRCAVSGSGFGSDSSAGTATGTFTDCTLTNTVSYGGTFTGTMRRCRFVCTGTNNNALRVGDGAKIFDSTLVATGTGNSITAGSAVTISLAGCRMNNSINANVSNNLGTLTESYNLIDSDIN